MYLRYLDPKLEKWLIDFAAKEFGINKKAALNKTVEKIIEFMQNPQTQEDYQAWTRSRIKTVSMDRKNPI